MKKLLIELLVVSLLFTSCTSWEIVEIPNKHLPIQLLLKDNTEVEIRDWTEDQDTISGTIVGKSLFKFERKFAKDDIQHIKQEVQSTTKNCLFISGGGLLFVIFIIWAANPTLR